ncbi:TrbL/VirB6 family protein [Lyticum sinuosum]|uniref:Type IV secretion system protein VirB6 n=1 Tax=Lyticum sinuosum TaxID=1332059 RepID=A0AAE4VJW1_9RICK|nr:type IV secretion system protein [Lyticum sinuosum]MDZ5760865.1 Type IV secretion system protein VirB6 [Lyticum sinuosum]
MLQELRLKINNIIIYLSTYLSIFIISIFFVIILQILFSSKNQIYATYIYQSECKFSDDVDLNLPNSIPILRINRKCTTACSTQCGLLFKILEKPPSTSAENTNAIRSSNADQIAYLNRNRIIDCINQCAMGIKYQGKIIESDGNNQNLSQSETVGLKWSCGDNSPDFVDIEVGKCDLIDIKLSNPGIELDVIGENILTPYYKNGRIAWSSNSFFSDGESLYRKISIQKDDELIIEYKGRSYSDNYSASLIYDKYRMILPLKANSLINQNEFLIRPVDPADVDDNYLNDKAKSNSQINYYSNIGDIFGQVSGDTFPSSFLYNPQYPNEICQKNTSYGGTYNMCYNDNIFPSFVFKINIEESFFRRVNINRLDINLDKYFIYISHKSGLSKTGSNIKICPLDEANNLVESQCKYGRSVETGYIFKGIGEGSYRITMDKWDYKFSDYVILDNDKIDTIISEIHPPFGGLGIEIIKNNSSNENFVCNIIKKVRNKLYGCAKYYSSGSVNTSYCQSNTGLNEDCDCRVGSLSGLEAPTDGIVYNLYKILLYGLTPFIKVMMLMYVLYISFSFTIGLRSMNSKEFLIFSLKFSLIAGLLSKGSWSLLYKYGFAIFIDGIDDMIDMFNYSTSFTKTTQSLERCVCGGPTVIKEIGDIWKQVFSDTLMNKIGALFFFGITGSISFVVISVMVLYGMFVFCLVSVKILIVYLLSTVMIGMMISISPLIIPFIMFGYTKSIFDNWVKQILMYFLQPVIVSVSFILFKEMFFLILQALTNFTICKMCLFNFSIFFSSWCPKVWLPVNYAHNNTDSVVSIAPIAFVSILIVAQAAYHFVSVTSEVLNRIISFYTTSTGGTDLMKATESVRSAFSNTSSGALGVIGLRTKDLKQMQGKMEQNNARKRK